ncbi:MAG: tetratricopeptide repeat protein [Spirochaetota bacterium]|nr:tetratricopeptide repeat protein [Spirochaetota bacterium]
MRARDTRDISATTMETPEEQTLEMLWADNKYNELSKKCEEILISDPLNPESLIYNGFSYFYLGIAQFTLEDQLPLLDSAILNLRKALLLNSSPLSGKVNYILGKSYYHKGRFYIDQAIYHLKKSIEFGYINEDTYKYMGLCYSELGFYEEGIEYFLKSIADVKDDMLLLVIGQTYHKLGDNINSELYLKRAIELNDDFRVEIKSRFLLGKIYFEEGELLQAEKEYELILSKDQKSADAYYYLGEIYSKRENTIKARAEWRKALELDPSHYGALLRLY